MPLQPIDLTTPQPNGKMGEPTRSAWEKTNDNNDYLEDISLAASSTANAAAPKVSPFFENTISSSQTLLENGAGAVRTIFDLAAPNGDDDRMQLLAVRITSGTGWTGVIYRLRRVVNGFQQGIIEFGQPITNTSVTIDGGRPWTTANTTVDSNNFIKRA